MPNGGFGYQMYNVVVFSRTVAEFDSWSVRHAMLAEMKDQIRLIALIEEPRDTASVSGVNPDLCISGKGYLERVTGLSALVNPEDLVLIAASDDNILSIGFPEDPSSMGNTVGFPPKSHFDAEMTPAKSNMAVYEDLAEDPAARIRRYFSRPLPADNSLYYGLFKFGPWFDAFLWSIEQVGGIEKAKNFHAFDWLWMSRLVFCGVVARPSDHFVIQRFKSPWERYHAKANYKNTGFVEGNPLWPLIRVLLTAYPQAGLEEPLYKWFEQKARERAALTNGEVPEDLLIQYIKALKDCNLISSG